VGRAERGSQPLAGESLQEVAGCTTREGVDHDFRTTRLAEDDDERLGGTPGDSADGGQTVPGKVELDQADVRFETRGGQDRGFGVSDYIEDDKSVGLERLADALARDRVIVSYENSQVLERDVPLGRPGEARLDNLRRRCSARRGFSRICALFPPSGSTPA
jgi:hypothetical protein